MRSELPRLARSVGVPERTLRRAVQRGTVRSVRQGPRRIAFDEGELAYVRANWPTISAIADALRTERNVRLAVVFGSVANGAATESSDIDILVSLTEDRPMYTAQLASRLRKALVRDIDILSVARLRERDPSLLATILRNGRPVIDRDSSWTELLDELPCIDQASSEARLSRRRRAAEAVAQLMVPS